jgi:hypothetical protein
VAQQLIAHGEAFTDKTELAVLVAVDDKIAPPMDQQLVLDDVAELLDVGGVERNCCNSRATNGCWSRVLRGADAAMAQTSSPANPRQ